MNFFTRHFMIREAVYSVAMEHVESCECVTCRAADGDDEAWAEIYREMSPVPSEAN